MKIIERIQKWTAILIVVVMAFSSGLSCVKKENADKPKPNIVFTISGVYRQVMIMRL